MESSFASLRGTLKSLQVCLSFPLPVASLIANPRDLVQSSLFQVFNALVRASPESREAVLKFFERVIKLNVKRAGMQVRSFIHISFPMEDLADPGFRFPG